MSCRPFTPGFMLNMAPSPPTPILFVVSHSSSFLLLYTLRTRYPRRDCLTSFFWFLDRENVQRSAMVERERRLRCRRRANNGNSPSHFCSHIAFFVNNPTSPQAVVDLLVMRELLCSEARSVTFSFMHDCFSSISISAGRHQQHRQDWRQERRMRESSYTGRCREGQRSIQHQLK